MIKTLNDCIEDYDNRSEFLAYENGKTYTLRNKSKFKIKKIKVDGCVHQDIGEKRCDYLMAIDEIKRAIFIELKGGGLIDAVKQLYYSILYLKKDLVNYKLDARIIGKGDVPGITNIPMYKKLQREVSNHGGTLKRATNKEYSEEI